MKIIKLYLSLIILSLSLIGKSNANPYKKYYGIWAPIGYNCKNIQEDQGDWIIIDKNYFKEGMSDGPACKEVNMYIYKNKLRMSASCEGPETGFFAVNVEFKVNGNRISYRRHNENMTLFRCKP